MTIRELDLTDIEIINVLLNNPSMSYSEVAENVGVSQPTVGKRIRNLKDDGILKRYYGIEFSNYNLCLVKIDVNIKDPCKIFSNINNLDNLVNCFITTDEDYNLTILLFVKNLKFAYNIVSEHIRSASGVNKVKMNLVQDIRLNKMLPIKSFNLK